MGMRAVIRENRVHYNLLHNTILKKFSFIVIIIQEKYFFLFPKEENMIFPFFDGWKLNEHNKSV